MRSRFLLELMFILQLFTVYDLLISENILLFNDYYPWFGEDEGKSGDCLSSPIGKDNDDNKR